MTDSGVDSESLSPSSPDSVSDQVAQETSVTKEEQEMVTGETGEDLVDKMEEEEDALRIDCEPAREENEKMETVAALLSLSESSRSPRSSPEKPLITLLPAHSPESGEQLMSD